MTGVATAVGIGGAVIGAVGANSAAHTQAAAQDRAAATQQHMFDTINGQEQPFMKAGYASTDKMNELLGIGGDKTASDYGSYAKPFTAADYLANKDPGYDFQLQQGAQALRNSATPGMGALSGAALKDLIGFNQNMAATGYQNAFNRFQTQQGNIFNRLQDVANRGQNAASNTGQAGTALGTGIAQAQAAAGASRAAGTVGVANSLSSGATLGAFLSGRGGSSFDPNGTGSLASLGPGDLPTVPDVQFVN